ncbi:transketolase-like TK C-terminal-containing protein [Pseudomonas sp. Au-Pse12]|uniref:transketolase-like TK C-terminal-containing protein n=1 Tax=Pseudomonas sp. Au-Pse12 TaxID=2906459 RepID=UPI001E3E2727|nr:pyruvate dehydrogenase [Pseudomonas sp. Au-Pse12]MCE4056276.1 pyruvate dehydrogenase [Pseudomonas sp. Au-Pse12]
MNPSSLFSTRTVAPAQQAAQACLELLRRAHNPGGSPLNTVLEMANTLELDRRTARQAWVVRSHGAQPRSTRISAWPLWFSTDTTERPLLYLHRSSSSAQLCAVSAETAARGILCNDSETQASPWPKGADPSLALWLAHNPHCLPFDPATGAEAEAIVLEALQRLYIEGQPGFYYLALHDHELHLELAPEQKHAALQGMYKVADIGAPTRDKRVRLLGAGRAFAQVRAAADLLERDWSVASQLWSCPSYTRLAREAAAAQRWNRLHPAEAKRDSHLQRCLAGGSAPVIAVTGYGQAVAEQLRPHLQVELVALGSDSFDAVRDPRRGRCPEARWIAVLALKSLADTGQLPRQCVEQAMRTYGLP